MVEYAVEHKKETDVRRSVFRTLAKANITILEMKDAGLSLEDAYMQLTKTTAAKPTRKKRGGEDK